MLPSTQTFLSFRNFAWSNLPGDRRKIIPFLRQRLGASDSKSAPEPLMNLSILHPPPPVSLKFHLKTPSLWTTLWRRSWDTSPPSSQGARLLKRAIFPLHQPLSLELWPWRWWAAERRLGTRPLLIMFLPLHAHIGCWRWTEFMYVTSSEHRLCVTLEFKQEQFIFSSGDWRLKSKAPAGLLASKVSPGLGLDHPLATSSRAFPPCTLSPGGFLCVHISSSSQDPVRLDYGSLCNGLIST